MRSSVYSSAMRLTTTHHNKPGFKSLPMEFWSGSFGVDRSRCPLIAAIRCPGATRMRSTARVRKTEMAIASCSRQDGSDFDAKTSDLTNDVLTTWQVRRGRICRALVHKWAAGATHFPFRSVSDDPDGDRHAEPCHPIEHVAADVRSVR